MLAKLRGLEGASESHSEIRAAGGCAIHNVARVQGKQREKERQENPEAAAWKWHMSLLLLFPRLTPVLWPLPNAEGAGK